MSAEREISIKEMLYYVLKRWRMVILLGIICAVLGGAYKFASGIITTTNEEALDKAKEKYEIELADYKATGELLTENIKALREKSVRQTEYNDNSLLMKIDPLNKFTGAFDIYIDSKYQIDPNLTYQNTDMTGRLVSAYSSYMTRGELYNYILSNTDIVSELRYLKEILSFSANSGASVITVSCVGDTEAHVQEIMELVKNGISQKYQDIQKAIGEHDYSILMESVYNTVDFGLDSTQKANKQVISEYANQIGKTNTELREWAIKGEPQPEYGYGPTIKNAIKSAIIGGVIGVMLCAGYYAVGFAFSSKLRGGSVWKSMNMEVLGLVGAETKKKKGLKIDKWIDKKLGEKNTLLGFEESCALLSANTTYLLQRLGLERAGIVSLGDAAKAEKIISIVNQNDKFEMCYAGNILVDSAAVKALDGIENILLFAEEENNTVQEVETVKSLLASWGKTILGSVVIQNQ